MPVIYYKLSLTQLFRHLGSLDLEQCHSTHGCKCHKTNLSNTLLDIFGLGLLSWTKSPNWEACPPVHQLSSLCVWSEIAKFQPPQYAWGNVMPLFTVLNKQRQLFKGLSSMLSVQPQINPFSVKAQRFKQAKWLVQRIWLHKTGSHSLTYKDILKHNSAVWSKI